MGYDGNYATPAGLISRKKYDSEQAGGVGVSGRNHSTFSDVFINLGLAKVPLNSPSFLLPFPSVIF